MDAVATTAGPSQQTLWTPAVSLSVCYALVSGHEFQKVKVLPRIQLFTSLLWFGLSSSPEFVDDVRVCGAAHRWQHGVYSLPDTSVCCVDIPLAGGSNRPSTVCSGSACQVLVRMQQEALIIPGWSLISQRRRFLCSSSWGSSTWEYTNQASLVSASHGVRMSSLAGISVKLLVAYESIRSWLDDGSEGPMDLRVYRPVT